MISLIRGKIIYLGDGVAVLENNGLGYEVFVSGSAKSDLKLGEPATLWTHEYIREDSRELFGFRNHDECKFFRRLISISGVGPKMALRLFELGKLEDIKKAILSGRAEFLSEAQGVGSKTAQKIILELRGKIDLDETAGSDDVIDALIHLGYSRVEAKNVISKISPTLITSETRLHEALKILGKR